MTKVSLHTSVPPEYAQELDRWISDHIGAWATRSDGMRALLSAALGLPRLQTRYLPTRQEQDERADRLLAKKHELGSWSAVAADEGLSVARVRGLIIRYENRMRRDAARGLITGSGAV